MRYRFAWLFVLLLLFLPILAIAQDIGPVPDPTIGPIATGPVSFPASSPIPVKWWIPAALGINLGIGLLKKVQTKIPKAAMPWVNLAVTAGLGFATGGAGAILPTVLGVGGTSALTYAIGEPVKKAILGVQKE